MGVQPTHSQEIVPQLPKTPTQQQRDVRVALMIVDKLSAMQKLCQIRTQLHELSQPTAENRKRSQPKSSLMLQPPPKKSRYTCSPVRVAEELTASYLPARDLIKYVPLKLWWNVADEGTGRQLWRDGRLHADTEDYSDRLRAEYNTETAELAATASDSAAVIEAAAQIRDGSIRGEESEQGGTFSTVPPCAAGCEEQEQSREDECSNNRENSSSRQETNSGVDGCEDDSGAGRREDDNGVDELKDDDGQDDSETDDEEDQGFSTDDEADRLIVAGWGDGPSQLLMT
ncbi:unnamed protein product [Phytophthora fragariaefolia]|uniref:Unnamed protein product n=1 Tax=Phytophthora fragariaefolia TaxID=1490495 RepID=A0A9W6YCT0_9STRA|nr:unnamed protein product [Phytophthora fragariaefolia]